MHIWALQSGFNHRCVFSSSKKMKTVTVLPPSCAPLLGYFRTIATSSNLLPGLALWADVFLQRSHCLRFTTWTHVTNRDNRYQLHPDTFLCSQHRQNYFPDWLSCGQDSGQLGRRRPKQGSPSISGLVQGTIQDIAELQCTCVTYDT